MTSNNKSEVDEKFKKLNYPNEKTLKEYPALNVAYRSKSNCKGKSWNDYSALS